jgi:hypothetical protein
MGGLVLAIGIYGALAALFFFIPFLTMTVLNKLFMLVAVIDGLLIGASPIGESMRLLVVNLINKEPTNLSNMSWGFGTIGIVALLATFLLVYFLSGKPLIAVISGSLSGIFLAATGLGKWINSFVSGNQQDVVVGSLRQPSPAGLGAHLASAALDAISAHASLLTTATTALHAIIG